MWRIFTCDHKFFSMHVCGNLTMHRKVTVSVGVFLVISAESCMCNAELKYLLKLLTLSAVCGKSGVLVPSLYAAVKHRGLLIQIAAP